MRLRALTCERFAHVRSAGPARRPRLSLLCADKESFRTKCFHRGAGGWRGAAGRRVSSLALPHVGGAAAPIQQGVWVQSLSGPRVQGAEAPSAQRASFSQPASPRGGGSRARTLGREYLAVGGVCLVPRGSGRCSPGGPRGLLSPGDSPDCWLGGLRRVRAWVWGRVQVGREEGRPPGRQRRTKAPRDPLCAGRPPRGWPGWVPPQFHLKGTRRGRAWVSGAGSSCGQREGPGA